MRTISKDQLIAWGPCDLDERAALFGDRGSLDVSQALDAGASVSDILWVAGRLGLAHECVQFALECAQRVAHLNSGPRVQAALDATATWLKNPSEENRQAAADAGAWAAARAAWADAEIEFQKSALIKIFS